jgi:hypothetical protein
MIYRYLSQHVDPMMRKEILKYVQKLHGKKTSAPQIHFSEQVDLVILIYMEKHTCICEHSCIYNIP